MADPATDAAAYFDQALAEARAAAAQAYGLAETLARLLDASLAAQGDNHGRPVSLDDVLSHARQRGGEAGRAQIQALLRHLVDLTQPIQPERQEEPEP